MSVKFRIKILSCLVVVGLVVTACSTTKASNNVSSSKESTSSVLLPSPTTIAMPTIPPYTVTTLLNITFSNNEDGFGLFLDERYSGINYACTLSVGQTINGGFSFANFHKIPLEGCSANFIDIDNQGVGILYDTGLAITDNNGASWTVTKFKNVISALVSGTTIWILTGRCNSFNYQTLKCYMVYSTDGGITWSSNIELPNEGTSTGVYQIAVDTSNSIYLLEQNPTVLSAMLFESSNNGESWQLLSSPECLGGPPKPVESLSLAQDSSLWLACASMGGSGNQLKSVAESSDGGKTWTDCAATPTPNVFQYTGPWCSSMGTLGYLGGIFGISSTTAVVYGGRNTIWFTHNSGVSFEPVQSPTQMVSIMQSEGGSGGADFINADDGWVIASPGGTSSLWYTTDGGITWTKRYSCSCQS